MNRTRALAAKMRRKVHVRAPWMRLPMCGQRGDVFTTVNPDEAACKRCHEVGADNPSRRDME